jgi:hypothetical protein
MNPVSVIAALLCLAFLALAAVYFIYPAGSLPSFLPGFEAGSDHIHSTHALVSLVVALIPVRFRLVPEGRRRLLIW